MSTNTIRHVSDDSKYKNFDPTGSSFPNTITNVQDALSYISLDGVEGLKTATETVEGKARLATQQEVIDGVSINTIVTPATLKGRLEHPNATETIIGMTRYATDAEAIDGTVTDAAIVPTSLKATIDYVFENRLANELETGVLKISTTPAALAGTDDTTAMSPLKVAQAINDATGKIPTYASATKTVSGLVRMATIGESQNGTADDGVAISPATLQATKATDTISGVIRLATLEEAENRTAGVALTPASLQLAKATSTLAGSVLITKTPEAGGTSNTALAWDANVLRTKDSALQTVTGPVNHTNLLQVNGNNVATEIGLVPIGGIIMYPANAGLEDDPAWHDCDGWNGYVADPNPIWNKLKAIWPNGLPDMRGLFARGIGRSIHMENELGAGATGLGPGEVQAQQIRYHKHVGGWGESAAWGPFGNTSASHYVGQKGSVDWNNRLYYTNDGRAVSGGINTVGLIGDESRPWNMSVRYLMRVY